jgi:hypothetical protein
MVFIWLIVSRKVRKLKRTIPSETMRAALRAALRETLRAALRETFLEAEHNANRSPMNLAGNARPHVAKSMRAFPDENLTGIAPRTPRSPDLNPSHSWLFRNVKRKLMGHSFETREELVDAVPGKLNEFLSLKSKIFLFHAGKRLHALFTDDRAL